MKHSSARYANYAFNFQRVNVILGANGSGKSKLLTEIKDQASALTGGFKAVYIEDGRTIKIKDVLQLDHTNFGQFDRYESALSHYNSKRATSLADRVFDSLVVLDKRDANLKSQHSDAVDKWISEGQKGDVPRRAQPPLEHLFELFSEIFPQITLSYDTQGRRLSAQKKSMVSKINGVRIATWEVDDTLSSCRVNLESIIPVPCTTSCRVETVVRQSLPMTGTVIGSFFSCRRLLSGLAATSMPTV